MNNGIASLTPSERDINTVLPDSKPVIQTSSLEVYVQLVEPVIFLRGFNLNNRQSYLDSHYVQDGEKPPPALLRGSVVIRILKPTRFKKIDLTLKGTSKVEWPEGLSQLRKEKNLDSQTQKNPKDEYSELYSLLNHNWPFYNYKSVRVPESSGKSNYERILEVTGASTYRPLQSINQFTNTTANGTGLRNAGYAGKRRVSFNDLGFRRGSTSGGLMGNFCVQIKPLPRLEDHHSSLSSLVVPAVLIVAVVTLTRTPVLIPKPLALEGTKNNHLRRILRFLQYRLTAKVQLYFRQVNMYTSSNS